MTLGVELFGKGSSDSFDCVTKAFKTALQASVGLDRDGKCIDVVLPASPSRKRHSPSLSPRDILSPGNVPEPGDTITLASGQTLRLIRLIPSRDDLTIPLSSILPSLPTIGNALGNTGNSLHSTFTALTGATGAMFTSFDAGENGGPGPVIAGDWSTIVGSLSTFMTAASRQRSVKAVFRGTTGAIVMSVVISVLQ
ncbi:MAG: hypothetical protein M1813_009003 [Trichoglossum hirsutum]|nr:MAG: hypothetical protein M1813_009003 [Trichoglossum hirsutum]